MQSEHLGWLIKKRGGSPDPSLDIYVQLALLIHHQIGVVLHTHSDGPICSLGSILFAFSHSFIRVTKCLVAPYQLKLLGSLEQTLSWAREAPSPDAQSRQISLYLYPKLQTAGRQKTRELLQNRSRKRPSFLKHSSLLLYSEQHRWKRDLTKKVHYLQDWMWTSSNC